MNTDKPERTCRRVRVTGAYLATSGFSPRRPYTAAVAHPPARPRPHDSTRQHPTQPGPARSGPARPGPALGWALRAGLAVLALVLTACGGGQPGPAAPPLPPGPELLTKAAAAMAGVHSASVDLQVDPALSSLPIRSATGQLTSTGDAQGSATVNQGGATADFQFVITQNRLYLKGPTGQFQQLPLALAASIYDPTALLSSDRGIPALLRTAASATTEALEDVNGAPAYRVRANLSANMVNSVVPGLTGATTGRVWIDQATSRLVKAQLEVPTSVGQGTQSQSGENGPTAPVTVTLSHFDAPVTITPPA
jgi:lipoprotein LprG